MIDPCSVPDKDQRPVIEWGARLMRKVPDLAMRRNLDYVGRLFSAGKRNPRQMERNTTEMQEKWTDGPDGVQPVAKKSSRFIEEAVVPLGHAVSMYGPGGHTAANMLQHYISNTQREYVPLKNEFLKVAGPQLSDAQEAKLNEFMDAISEGKKLKIKDPLVAQVAVSAMLTRFPDQFAHATAKSIGLSEEKFAKAKQLADWFANAYSMIEHRAIEEKLPFNPWTRSKYAPVMLRFKDLFPDLYPSLNSKEQQTRELKARDLRGKIVDQVHKNLGGNLTKIEIEAALKRWAQFGETPQFRRPLTDLMVKEDRHLEMHRLLDTTFGIEWNPHKIFHRYFRPALLRLNYAKVFGVNGEGMKPILEQLAAEKYDVQEFTKLFDFAAEQQVFGRNSLGPLETAAIKELGGLVAFHSLGTSVFSQLSTIPRVGEHVARKGNIGLVIAHTGEPGIKGVRIAPFLRSFPEAFRASVYQMKVLPEGIRNTIGKEALSDFVADAAAMIEAEEIGAIGRAGGLFPRLAHAEIHVQGMTTMDRFARNFAAIAGGHYMKFLQTQLDWARRRGDVAERESTLRHISEVLGDDPYWLEMAKDRHLNAEGKKKLQMIAGEVVHNRTQFRTLPIDLPLMANHPVGRLFYKLNSFNYRTTAETMRQFNLADPTSLMRNPVGRLRFLLALPPTLITTYAILRAKRYLQGKDPDSNDPFWRQFVDVLAYAGIGSMYHDTFDTWTGKYGPLERKIGGPAVSTALDLMASTGQTVATKSWDPTLRFLIQSIPLSFQVPLGLPTPKEMAKELVPPHKKPKSSPFAPARTRPFKPIGR